MHGDEHTGDDLFNGHVCEGYFCEAHLRTPCLEHEDAVDLADMLDVPAMCFACAGKVEAAYRADTEWREYWPTKEQPLAVSVDG
jgi:hypothetical protein